MTRARALVAAVPQRVWTAVAGLVLLASLGVTLVLTAGLATWQGAVSHSPGRSASRPPVSVVRPPASSVIVVPTPAGQGQHPVSSTGPGVAPGSVPLHQPVVVTPPPAPAATPQPQTTQTPQVAQPQQPAANPRLVGSGSAADTAQAQAQHGRYAKPTKAGHGKKTGSAKKAKQPKHANHGKHKGWAINGHGG